MSVVRVPVLGGLAYISTQGVTIARTPAGHIVLPPETVIERDAIRGWLMTPPTGLVPGFIDLLADDTAPLTSAEARTCERALRFGVAQDGELALDALTAMQAGDEDMLDRLSRVALSSGVDEAGDSDSDSASGSSAGAGSVSGNSGETGSDGATSESESSEALNFSDASDKGLPAEPAMESVESSPAPSAHEGTSSAGESASDKGKMGTSSGNVPHTGVNFIAFDVETANGANGSICQFGFAIYEDRKLTRTESWLCQPPSEWPEFTETTMKIHGITPEDVADQPTCRERLEAFGEIVRETGYPLVAHNAKFDMTALRDAAASEGVELPEIKFACTYLLARIMRPNLPNYKLPTVAADSGYDLTKHHDAAADAQACGEIMLDLCRDFSSVEECADSVNFQLGTVGSRVVNFRKKRKSPATSEPRWTSVATPDTVPDTNDDADPQGVLYGENVTLSGEFSPLDKGELWNAIANAGGTVGKNVTKKTTILVCGEWNGKTSKQKRAEELQEKGQEISIWTQAQLLEALELN